MSVRFLPNIKSPSTLIWPHGDNAPNKIGESSPVVFTQNPDAEQTPGGVVDYTLDLS